MKTIKIYNHAHYGDIFYSRILINALKPHFNIEYYHSENGLVLNDLPEILEFTETGNVDINDNIITLIGGNNNSLVASVVSVNPYSLFELDFTITISRLKPNQFFSLLFNSNNDNADGVYSLISFTNLNGSIRTLNTISGVEQVTTITELVGSNTPLTFKINVKRTSNQFIWSLYNTSNVLIRPFISHNFNTSNPLYLYLNVENIAALTGNSCIYTVEIEKQIGILNQILDKLPNNLTVSDNKLLVDTGLTLSDATAANQELEIDELEKINSVLGVKTSQVDSLVNLRESQDIVSLIKEVARGTNPYYITNTLDSNVFVNVSNLATSTTVETQGNGFTVISNTLNAPANVAGFARCEFRNINLSSENWEFYAIIDKPSKKQNQEIRVGVKSTDEISLSFSIKFWDNPSFAHAVVKENNFWLFDNNLTPTLVENINNNINIIIIYILYK